MTPDQVFDEFQRGFVGRKFVAGLLIAFIDLIADLDLADKDIVDLDSLLERFPRQERTAAGKSANTLILRIGDDRTVSLRPYYNAAESLFRNEHKRFDYPSCAPHATQAWRDYTHWLDALVRFGRPQLLSLRRRVVEFVLSALVDQSFDPTKVRREPPLFERLLENFELTAAKGEPSGAVLQGVVFGFLRADNPHLQFEIDKVRTGSRRLQRIADIDGWDGSNLALSAEVKQFALALEDVGDLQGFAHEVGKRGALGIAAALEFKDDARGAVEGLGLRALSLDDMRRIVSLWDPLKQRTAIASLAYYAGHVEKNASLSSRIEAFVAENSAPTLSIDRSEPHDPTS